MTRTNALLALVALLCVAAGFADWQVFRLGGRVATDQQANTAALCAFRSDLQKRVTSGNNFLLTHPHGIPGVPAPTIRQGLQNEQATLNALSPVRCH